MVPPSFGFSKVKEEKITEFRYASFGFAIFSRGVYINVLARKVVPLD